MHGGCEVRVSHVDTAAKRIMKNKCVTEESIWLTALKSKSWSIYICTLRDKFLLCFSAVVVDGLELHQLQEVS